MPSRNCAVNAATRNTSLGRHPRYERERPGEIIHLDIKKDSVVSIASAIASRDAAPAIAAAKAQAGNSSMSLLI
jgi:hypothetical protein